MTDIEVQSEWVTRLQDTATQAAALTELRAVLVRGLQRAFRGKGGGDAFCEDVAQETLIRVLDKLDQFAGRSRFTTWAMSIAVRIGTSQFRRKMFKDVSINSVDSDQNLNFQFADASTVPADSVHYRRSLLEELRRLIAEQLTAKQRQATEAILNGMPIEEIAERTNSNRNAIYKLIHDARVRLKAGLESAGYVGDDIIGEFA